MIDWARVNDLREEVGVDAFGEVLELFLEEMNDAMARLAAGPDPDRLPDELHFVRGAALNLGLREFCTLCQRMEHSARTGGTVDLVALADSYRSARQILLDRQPGAEGTA